MRELVRVHGHDSLAFFSLRRDKSYFFSPTRRSFLAYRVVEGCALVSGDPIGDDESSPSCSPSFGGSAAHAAGGSRWSARRGEISGRTGVSACARSRSATRRCVRPTSFSLEGRAIRKVRQSVTRLEKARAIASASSPPRRRPALRSELEDVSAAWRGSNVERGFSMAMDDLAEPETMFAFVERRGHRGRLPPSRPEHRRAGYSLGAMRRRPGNAERPHGVPDRRSCSSGRASGPERDLPQLLRVRRLPRRRASCRRGRRSGARCGSATGSSSSSGSSCSAESSRPSGARATSASSGCRTCRLSAWLICASSRS